MQSPKLLIVGNFLSSHGSSRGVCEELAPRFQTLGWRVLTTSSRRFRPARLADMLSVVGNRRQDYDIAQVDVYSGRAFVWAESVCWLLRQIGKPYVLTLHGGSLPDFARVNEKRVRRLLNSAAEVTVPSPYLLNHMTPYRRDLKLIPNGLDVAAYEAPERGVLRHVPRHVLQPRLIWLRAYHKVYNPTLAVRTAASLTSEFPALQLTMAGPDRGDSSKEATIAAVAACSVQGHVKVQGGIAKTSVPQCLAAGDIFLNTTNVDNTPVTVLEAMASGMCVVSTNVGGIPDLLRSGEDSLLVPPNDEAAMAAAVRRLLTEPELAARIRRASLAKVRQFDWNVVLPQWQELLTSAAQKRSPRNAGAAAVRTVKSACDTVASGTGD